MSTAEPRSKWHLNISIVHFQQYLQNENIKEVIFQCTWISWIIHSSHYTEYEKKKRDEDKVRHMDEMESRRVAVAKFMQRVSTFK